MSQLGNVLARDKRIAKSGFDDGRFNDGGRCRVCTWKVSRTNVAAEG